MIRAKKAPYRGTEVPPERTKGEVERLLRDFGADGVSWTEIWSQNRAQLQFILEVEANKRVLVRLEPPAFLGQHRSYNAATGRSEVIKAANWAQSYRLLKAYLKAKLESIAYGLRDVEEEFLADLVVTDRQGRERTVREIYNEQIGSGELRRALGPGLPPVRETQTVDAEVVR